MIKTFEGETTLQGNTDELLADLIVIIKSLIDSKKVTYKKIKDIITWLENVHDKYPPEFIKEKYFS